MQSSIPITCPYCGQSFDLIVDTSVATQRLITDCEICCRPFTLSVQCEPGEVVDWNVDEN